MSFLAGEKLNRSIKRLMRGQSLDCAVAFWGAGAMEWLGNLRDRNIRIVCNLLTGGTNPYVIEDIISDGKKQKANIEVRHHIKLHAKVYLSESEAIVGSANVSTNGLGLHGTEIAYWVEVGVILNDIRLVREWFDEIWSASIPIEKSQIEETKKIWKRRQKLGRPPVPSIAEFDLEACEAPILVTWVPTRRAPKGSIVREAVRKQVGKIDDGIADSIENGLDIEGPEDLKILTPNRWILGWYRGNDGLPGPKSKLWWFRTGPTYRKSYLYEGEQDSIDVVARADDSATPSPPFGIDDPLLLQALRTILASSKFRTFLRDDYPGAWFADRIHKMPLLLTELKREYIHAKSFGNG